MMAGGMCFRRLFKGVFDMVVLKMITKILLLPVVAALTLIRWAGIFLNSVSGVILGILAFIFALTGIASLAFGLASGPEALKMMHILDGVKAAFSSFAPSFHPIDLCMGIAVAAVIRLVVYVRSRVI